MAYLIVGLGNPGAEYEYTRHNTGRFILEQLAKKESGQAKWSGWESDKKLSADKNSGTLTGEKVTLLLPNTFMNKSGQSVRPLISNNKQAERLVVVHDDLDLPLGTWKIVFGRGAGGHRGVESIMRAIKTKDFVRCKIGISPHTPGGKLKKPQGEKAVQEFILGRFRPAESEELKKVSKKIQEALVVCVVEGRERAMNQFN